METNLTMADMPEVEDYPKNVDYANIRDLPEVPENSGVVAAQPQIGFAVAIAEDQHETDEDILPKKKGRLRKVIILLVVLVIAAFVAYYFIKIRTAPVAQTSSDYTYYMVSRRDITKSLSGSGTLQPADSYSVTALVSGEILSADFEEGDIIEKDTVLYQIDSSDTRTNIEQAENSLAQSRKSYNQRVKSLDDLQIKANGSGSIISMNVDVGDKVSAGQQIASIRDSEIMTLKVPFGTDDADRLSVGQTAEVVLDGTFERLSGTIENISVLEELLTGNMIVRMVTIDVVNPGGISLSHVATASVGDIFCNGSGSFKYKEEKTVTASMSGEVVAVNASEGDTVQKNSLLVQLKSDSLTNEIENSANSLRNEELSLDNRYKQLDNFTITSPIAGTIVDKTYKEGDKLDTGKVLCIIYDLSYLTMVLNVDELDISSVHVGQDVTVTAEALDDKAFNGVVTRININGTTINGVTSYPVTIRIDDTEGLLPGMNVQAEIIVSHSSNVLAIPVSALSRGNRVLVNVSGIAPKFSGGAGGNRQQFGGEGRPQFDSENMSQSGGEGRSQFGSENMPQSGSEDRSQFGSENMPQSGGEGRPQFDSENMPQSGGESRNPGLFSRESQQNQPQLELPVIGADGLPEGYQYVVVTTGVSDENYIEITSGLQEGDAIAYIPDTSDGGFYMPGMGMMPGGGFYRTNAMPAGGGTRGNFGGGTYSGGGGGASPGGGGNSASPSGGGPMG